jgi:hypothetical protein
MQLRFFLATLAACASVLSCPSAWAMAKKPKVTVRFHAEANPRDGESFARPIKLKNLRRDAFMSRVPEFSERNIVAVFPFRAADNTWGCAFQFDIQGRIRLETMSNQARGSALVVFIGTKNGQHQVIDMLIDTTVSDGIITVPRGITDGEALILRQQFPIMGQEKKKKAPPKKEEPGDGDFDRRRSQPPPPSSEPPAGVNPYAEPPTAPAKPGRKSPEPALPRVAD